MARHKLQDKKVASEKLDPGQTDKLLSDGENLYLRIRPDGKSWWYIFKSPITGKRRKLALGAYPTISLAKAREEAEKARVLVSDGIDPLHHAEQEELMSQFGDAPRTVQELFERWKKDYLQSHHKDGGDFVEGMLTRHALPLLGKVELDRLRAPHIAAVLTKVKCTGKKRVTAIVLSNIRQMCSFAVECGWLQGDPTAAMKKTTWAGPKVKRDRVLSEEEIQGLAGKVPKAGLSAEIECAIWIMLSCMTRVEETTLARLQDVDFKNMVWRIPVENQKKVRSDKPQKDHYVSLSPFALRWFERLVKIPQERAEHKNGNLPKSKRLETVPPVEVDWMFPSVKRGEGSINEKTIAHALNDRQKPGQEPLKGRTPLVDSLVLPGGKWAAHDLRRTGSTLARELGVPQDVIDRCLNHVESDAIVATYQHAQLRDEMKDAWLRLGKRLEELTSSVK